MASSSPLSDAKALLTAFKHKNGNIHLFSPGASRSIQSRDHEELGTFLEEHPDAQVDLVTSSGDAIGIKIYGAGAPGWQRGPTTDDSAQIIMFKEDLELPAFPTATYLIQLDDLWEATTRPYFELREVYGYHVFAPDEIKISWGQTGQARSATWNIHRSSWLDFALRLQGRTGGRWAEDEFLQGEAAGGTRKAMSMISNSILAVDIVSGDPIEKIRDSIIERGLEAVVFTKQDHMKPYTEINRDKYWAWLDGQHPDLEQLKIYLEIEEGLLPELLRNCKIIDEARHTADGVMIVVEHEPVPRFQAVFPLAQSFVFATQAKTQKEAILEWRDRYAGFCGEIGFRCRYADTDPSRSFALLPREKEGRWEAWWIAGAPLELQAYPKLRLGRVVATPGSKGVSGAPAGHGRGQIQVASSTSECRTTMLADKPLDHAIERMMRRSEIVENDLAGRDPDEARHLLELNQKCALVPYGGKLRVLYEPQTPNDDLKLMSVQDARVMEAPRAFFRERAGGKGVEKVVPFNLWLDWPHRREFDGIVFQPGRSDDRNYNRFRGWAVTPKPGDWSILRNHLLEIFCHSDPELFEWLMTWLAQLFQYPGIKPGSAIVARGKKGCGKSIVFDFIAQLLGPAFSKAADTRRLLGNFNASLDHNLLFLLEESHWNGDKTQEGILKDLITSPLIPIERKGIDSELKANFTRLVMLSNESWIIPATFDERRYAIFDCADGRRNDHAYFQAMVRQMNEEGGLAAMLHDLLSFQPASGWDVLRQPPTTIGLLQQIEETLQGTDLFMFELLKYGIFESTDDEAIELFEDRPCRITAKALRSAIDEFLKNNDAGRRRKPGYSAIDHAFREWTGGFSEMETISGMQNRTRILTFPPLGEARSFAERTKGVRFGI